MRHLRAIGVYRIGKVRYDGAVEVAYEDPRFEAFLTNQRALTKAYGAVAVTRLAVRLTSIREAQHLAELHQLPGRTHPLTADRAGRFAMDLPNGLRLEFRPTPPVPLKPDGGIDIHRVTQVTLLEISHHYS